MMSTLEVISKFLNIIRLAMKLHLPIFVVAQAVDCDWQFLFDG